MPMMSTDDGVAINYNIDDFRDPWLPESDVAVVMSHGFSRSMKWFQQWVPTLARKYKVVRYDVRGCGGINPVPPSGADWTAERLAKDVVNLIDSLGIGQIHWVSFESGGLWGMVFASAYPDRILSLSTCNTPSGAWTQGRQGRMTSFYADKGELVSEAIAKKGIRQWVRDTNPARLGSMMENERLVEWHTVEQSKTPTEVAVAIERIVETIDLAKVPSKVKVPVFLIIGDRTPSCPTEEQVKLQQAFPDARLLVMPNVGIGIQLKEADICASEVLKFIEGV